MLILSKNTKTNTCYIFAGNTFEGIEIANVASHKISLRIWVKL